MFATIDIGTNSVLLLIGEVLPDGNIRTVKDLMTVTKLGEGVAATGKISDAAMARTIGALKSYWEECVRHGVLRVAVVGTAALRNAKNAADFLALAKKELGLDMEIISGERESELAFEASARDFGRDIFVVDIGGGSTEFIVPAKKGGGIEFKSLPIGCVSLTEKFLKSDPPFNGEILNLQRAVRAALEKGLDLAVFARPHDRELVAGAGTATTIAAMILRLEKYDPQRVHGMKIKIALLRGLIADIKTKSLEERKKMPGLHPSRADVIISGACILQEAMSHLGYASAIISDRGIRWGLFHEKFCP